ncbi:hypothetical protein F3Y22_tig00110794pilonHSYRG00194 [Hibiscus syriacus]|uniref:Classical arabinogalactan protein 26-like n=1 Tax=Hibiscus syriacus TaxID=106335 RepID=A0A6A2ZQB6_HIBSY|nr:classical arabinogalactan protein 26-like [Hibiscus syriacus]KAE8693756.1 hypothetical protein F3Y22_tig00110794pilonHSYRG00194 [Hibiscus syriacus]
MASASAAIWSFIVFVACFSSPALSSSQLHVQYSTISAAPAFLPTAPTLSPDTEPLFPTPKGMSPAPADSSFPTIPSSPSPPDPNSVLAPGPGIALAPSGSLPVSTSVSLTSDGAPKSTLFLGLVVALCLLQQLWWNGIPNYCY